jgi:hypothetical protein
MFRKEFERVDEDFQTQKLKTFAKFEPMQRQFQLNH